MNLVMMTEGTGQGVSGRKTNVSRLYDLLVENGNQRLNLEAGPGTHAFRHFGGTFFGTDAMSIVNHHQNWFLNHAPRAGKLNIFLFGFSRGALIMRVVADWLCQRGFPVEYMGLWDTVDSTAGIKGEDYIELPSNVKFARHAVARDEQMFLKTIRIFLSSPYHPRIYFCGLRNGERKQTATMTRSEIHESFEFFLNEP